MHVCAHARTHLLFQENIGFDFQLCDHISSSYSHRHCLTELLRLGTFSAFALTPWPLPPGCVARASMLSVCTEGHLMVTDKNLTSMTRSSEGAIVLW